MKKLFIALVAMVCMVSMVSIGSMAEARDVSGKNIPESMTVDGQKLILNGAGTRTKMWLSIYAAGLYLPAKMKNAQKIIDADIPMALRIHVISGLMSPKKMESAYREGFEASTNGNIAPIKERMDKFILPQKSQMAEDTVLDYVYVPGKGIRVMSKGKVLATIEGLDFKKAVFGIWLCDDPCDEDLKEGLLDE